MSKNVISYIVETMCNVRVWTIVVKLDIFHSYIAVLHGPSYSYSSVSSYVYTVVVIKSAG